MDRGSYDSIRGKSLRRYPSIFFLIMSLYVSLLSPPDGSIRQYSPVLYFQLYYIILSVILVFPLVCSPYNIHVVIFHIIASCDLQWRVQTTLPYISYTSYIIVIAYLIILLLPELLIIYSSFTSWFFNIIYSLSGVSFLYQDLYFSFFQIFSGYHHHRLSSIKFGSMCYYIHYKCLICSHLCLPKCFCPL